MRDEREFDVGYRLLDHQLVDVNGRRCGRVDDVEIAGGPGQPAHLTAVLTGRGVWHRRLPRRLRRAGERLFGRPTHGKNVFRIPWTDVDDIASVVALRRPADELGLEQGERLAEAVLERVPGA